jgi:PAS domain-containing protein
MRLPLPIHSLLAAALVCAGGGGVALAADEVGTTYRCPNNDYKNTISAKEAERLGCKKLEGAPVTVIQMSKPRPSGTAVPAAAGSGAARVDPAAQKARDSDARRILENELRTEEDRLAALKREYNNGQPSDRATSRTIRSTSTGWGSSAPRSPARKPTSPPSGASCEAAARPRPAVVTAAGPPAAAAHRADDAAGYAALDLLATMVAVVTPEGECIFANSSFEDALGLSRRSMSRGSAFDWFADAQLLQGTVAAVSNNVFATSRLDAQLKRPGATHGETLPVRVIVNQIDSSRNVVFEIVEIEQQTRQEREERALEQAQATKELIRNLAHEIKNPLGGIRGAGQLREMEIESRTLTEYTQVIINEADRLQSLVDACWRRTGSPTSLATSTSTRSASGCGR